LKNSIFLSNVEGKGYYIEDWKNKKMNDRMSNGMLRWNNQSFVSLKIKEIIDYLYIS
jgi:hypothetical protein